MKALLLAILPVAIAGCTAVGPYGRPYATVESGYLSAVRKELPVIISSVDGRSPLERRRSGPLEPGRHQFVVVHSADYGLYSKYERLVEIDAARCTRYRIVARYENRTHLDWVPVVYPEPIGECVVAFGPAR